ncbi:hypothetical protein ACOMCU_00965 [Lysinibacillus sp. UGB7]|uniref:hypothetical protein n=1 Tax=Lysinibacillus TaxID=400634 RepID=UPI0018CF6D4B|nr:hypothetical protein [Lysinibacillus sphaericus]
MDETKLYIIETKNGKYISMGKNEHEAKINFTITFPNEKIRTIEESEDKALWLTLL